MIRLLTATLVAVSACAGAAAAEPVVPPLAGAAVISEIGGAPWAAIAGASGIAADDAFVFAQTRLAQNLEPDALAVAVSIDQGRIAGDEATAGMRPGASNRFAAAFEPFVAVGDDGVAYATVAYARDGDAVVFARAPQPSIVAMLLQQR